jgi:ABC-type nitrate/sulfonate/bicarbonate transport system permease component
MASEGRFGSMSASLPAQAPRPIRLYAEYERLILGALAIVVFLVFWEGLGRGWWAHLLRPVIGPAAEHWVVRPIFVSSPTRIAEAAYRMYFITGEILADLKWSALGYVLGLLLAIGVGIPLGLASGWYRRFSYAAEPFLSAFNATPQVAFLPLIIVWVGTGLAAKVLIIFLLAVLPIAISAQSAVRTTDPRLLKVASSFSAGQWLLFRSIILPNAVPYLLSGLRLAIGRAMIGIVVGEIYGSAPGVGMMINQAGSRFETDKVFVGVLTIVAVGMILSELVRRIERRVEIWRPPLG